jgi:catechol 2,3-dioxygenase-like lactoylglutathione lyase family enzyme
MIKVTRIGHATFETPDLERQIDYFTNVVGLVLAERDGGRAYLATRVGDLAVQLDKGDASRCSRLSFQAAPGTDFGNLRRGLEAEGLRCELRSDPSPGIPEVITFADPKGTMIDVFTTAQPFERKGAVAGIGPLKLGHLAFCVEDPKAFADFYMRVLGFRLSDWIEDWFVFLRCGPDHHTVNFVQGKTTRMHHVAFELKDWAQIQTACDFLGGRNIQLAWGPGRHGPGHNIYTYHRNPDDQIVELFTELDKMMDESLGYFDPRPWHRDRPQRPKVWGSDAPRDIWGPPPTRDYLRQRD